MQRYDVFSNGLYVRMQVPVPLVHGPEAVSGSSRTAVIIAREEQSAGGSPKAIVFTPRQVVEACSRKHGIRVNHSLLIT